MHWTVESNVQMLMDIKQNFFWKLVFFIVSTYCVTSTTSVIHTWNILYKTIGITQNQQMWNRVYVVEFQQIDWTPRLFFSSHLAKRWSLSVDCTQVNWSARTSAMCARKCFSAATTVTSISNPMASLPWRLRVSRAFLVVGWSSLSLALLLLHPDHALRHVYFIIIAAFCFVTSLIDFFLFWKMDWTAFCFVTSLIYIFLFWKMDWTNSNATLIIIMHHCYFFSLVVVCEVCFWLWCMSVAVFVLFFRSYMKWVYQIQKFPVWLFLKYLIFFGSDFWFGFQIWSKQGSFAKTCNLKKKIFYCCCLHSWQKDEAKTRIIVNEIAFNGYVVQYACNFF